MGQNDTGERAESNKESSVFVKGSLHEGLVTVDTQIQEIKGNNRGQAVSGHKAKCTHLTYIVCSWTQEETQWLCSFPNPGISKV